METKKDQLNITVTDSAISQILLIKENDFTLTPKSLFRVKIGGKGCDGFTYETGFSEKVETDLEYTFNGVTILLDSFTAFYFKNGKIDFVHVVEHDADGFKVENFDEANHKGKFFKDETKVPSIDS
jgi:iron-sulfur cluster assembly accessory protein